MSALEYLEAARQAWQRSQPQLFLEVDGLDPDLPPLPHHPLDEAAADPTPEETP